MQLAIERNVYIVDTSPNSDYELDHANALHLYEKYGFRCKIVKDIKNSKTDLVMSSIILKLYLIFV
jgi:serine protease inhibitor